MTTLEESFKYCENLTRAHYENFPVGSFLVPKEKRKYIWAIYAFARTADDFADEGRKPDESPTEIQKRLDQIADWEHQLDLSLKGQASHPAFVALAETLRVLSIPDQLLRDLLTAYRMDLQKKRYENFEELFHYCKHSANPVGRLVLYTFGYRDASLHQLSDHICTALQLANFWQDVAVDLEKDRIYLPLDAMKKFGVTEDQLRAHECSPAFKELLKFCSNETAKLFNQGLPLCSTVKRDLRLEMRLTWLGGTTILKKTAQNQFDVFHHRPVITMTDKIRLALKAFAPGALKPLPLL